jgi:hypothetical protein
MYGRRPAPVDDAADRPPARLQSVSLCGAECQKSGTCVYLIMAAPTRNISRSSWTLARNTAGGRSCHCGWCARLLSGRECAVRVAGWGEANRHATRVGLICLCRRHVGALGLDIEELQRARFDCLAELLKQSPHSRAASVLLGAFFRRLMVDCDASGAPLSGQRPTATFIN